MNTFLKQWVFLGIGLVALFACHGPSSEELDTQKHSERPNIVLIMGDDIGFSDLGSYGSSIQTPVLDSLAHNGMRFTQFYNMAKCSPSRSALQSGLYKGGKNTPFVSQILDSAGYTTIKTGKEHLDKWVPEHAYGKYSFDYSFVFPAINEFFIPEDSTFQNSFFLNGEKIPLDEIKVNKQPFYKTDVITDYAIDFLDEAQEKGGPFFLYLPYHVAHYPLQARSEDIAKYKGMFMDGWQAIREVRHQRLKDEGLIPDNAALTPPEGNIHKSRDPVGEGWEDIRAKIPQVKNWDTLAEWEKRKYDLEMAVYAGMIDRMDQNIGRILNMIEQMGRAENTVVFYLSDNGGCPYDSNRDFMYPPSHPHSYRTYDAMWSNVSNTPFRHHKQFGHEGGSHTHLIAYWPGHIKGGAITDALSHIVDITPTILDIIGIDYPDEFLGHPTIPMHGRSLLPVLQGGDREAPDFILSGVNENFRMYREGDWKLVRANDGPWQLYNMEEDPTELNNLADENKKKREVMMEAYRKVRHRLDSASVSKENIQVDLSEITSMEK